MHPPPPVPAIRLTLIETHVIFSLICPDSASSHRLWLHLASLVCKALWCSAFSCCNGISQEYLYGAQTHIAAPFESLPLTPDSVLQLFLCSLGTGITGRIC